MPNFCLELYYDTSWAVYAFVVVKTLEKISTDLIYGNVIPESYKVVLGIRGPVRDDIVQGSGQWSPQDRT